MSKTTAVRLKLTGNLVLTTELKTKLATVKGGKADVSSVSQPFHSLRGSDERLTLKMSAFSLFTVANLRFQLSC